MKNKIEVFKKPLSDEVIKTFDNVDDLLKYNEVHSLMADQIAINDCILLGWDELYMFLNQRMEVMDNIKELIKEWQDKLEIAHWNITTEKIDPKQVIHDGEDYFIGIAIDWDTLRGVIYHDIDLNEEAIVHELLHVRYSTENEDWINETTNQYLHSKYKY